MKITKEKMIGQGNTAEIYRLVNKKILKLFRAGFPKEATEREYRNAIIVQDILDCVPKVYEMVEIEGRHGIVYEEIKGKDLLKTIISSFVKINHYAKKLAHYHLDIQKPVDETLYSVKDKLEEDINSVNELSEAYKEVIRKYLKQLPEGNMLCHFDFHPGNIIVTDNKAVFLDWMTACKGDACADVARTSIMLKYGGVEHASWIMKKFISIFQSHIYKVYIKEYLRITNRSIEDINRWELPVAAARLREWIPEDEKQILVKLVKERCNDIAKREITSK